MMCGETVAGKRRVEVGLSRYVVLLTGLCCAFCCLPEEHRWQTLCRAVSCNRRPPVVFVICLRSGGCFCDEPCHVNWATVVFVSCASACVLTEV